MTRPVPMSTAYNSGSQISSCLEPMAFSTTYSPMRSFPSSKTTGKCTNNCGGKVKLQSWPEPSYKRPKISFAPPELVVKRHHTNASSKRHLTLYGSKAAKKTISQWSSPSVAPKERATSDIKNNNNY